MTTNLLTALPLLLPKAIAWAEAQQTGIFLTGTPLNERLLGVASRVGVARPELIRVAEVLNLPLPDDLDLKAAALETGLIGDGMIGMTFGYGVYVCRGRSTVQLLSHEFRHVHQYEQAGSIAGFLPAYLHQIVTFGYSEAPFEKDARLHEIHSA